MAADPVGAEEPSGATDRFIGLAWPQNHPGEGEVIDVRPVRAEDLYIGPPSPEVREGAWRHDYDVAAVAVHDEVERTDAASAADNGEAAAVLDGGEAAAASGDGNVSGNLAFLDNDLTQFWAELGIESPREQPEEQSEANAAYLLECRVLDLDPEEQSEANLAHAHAGFAKEELAGSAKEELAGSAKEELCDGATAGFAKEELAGSAKEELCDGAVSPAKNDCDAEAASCGGTTPCAAVEAEPAQTAGNVTVVKEKKQRLSFGDVTFHQQELLDKNACAAGDKPAEEAPCVGNVGGDANAIDALQEAAAVETQHAEREARQIADAADISAILAMPPRDNADTINPMAVILTLMLRKFSESDIRELIYKIVLNGGIPCASMFAGACTDLVAMSEFLKKIGIAEYFVPKWMCEIKPMKQAFITKVVVPYIMRDLPRTAAKPCLYDDGASLDKLSAPCKHHNLEEPEEQRVCELPRGARKTFMLTATPSCTTISKMMANRAEKALTSGATSETFDALFNHLEAHDVPILLIENVPELVTSDEGNMVATVITKLDALGYCSRYAIVDAFGFAHPEHRDRAYLVAWKYESLGISKTECQGRLELVRGDVDKLKISANDRITLKELLCDNDSEMVQKALDDLLKAKTGEQEMATSPRHNHLISYRR